MNIKNIFLLLAGFIMNLGADSVDVNKPITNKILKEKLKIYNDNPTNKNKNEILKEIKKSNLMGAMLADSIKTGVDSNGNPVLLPGSKMIFLMTKDDKENNLTAVFTDWDEIRLFSKENVSTLILKNEDVELFSKNGIMINPISNKFIIKK